MATSNTLAVPSGGALGETTTAERPPTASRRFSEASAGSPQTKWPGPVAVERSSFLFSRRQSECSSANADTKPRKLEKKALSEDSSDRPTKSTTRRRMVYLLLFLLLLGSVSILGFVAFAKAGFEKQAQAVFAVEAGMLAQGVKASLDNFDTATAAIQAYVESAEGAPTHHGFRIVAERMLAATGAETFQYLPIVRSASRRAALEAGSAAYWNQRLGGNQTSYPFMDRVSPDLEPVGSSAQVASSARPEARGEHGMDGLEPSPEAEVYLPVVFVEPAETNKDLIHLNVLSGDPRRLELAERSIQGGHTLSTGLVAPPVGLANSSFSVFVQAPIAGDEAVVTSEARVDGLLNRVLGGVPPGLRVFLFANHQDGEVEHFGGFAGAPARPIAVQNNSFHAISQHNGLLFTQEFHALGQNWTVAVLCAEAFDPINGNTIFVPSALLAVLFVGLALLVVIMMRREKQHSHSKALLVAEQARKAAHAVTRAERNLNDFLAHEVRNPLSVAISAQRFLVTSLQSATWSDEDASSASMRDLDLIGSSLSFILELVSNMLDLNKFLEQQTVAMNPTTVSLGHDVLEPVKSMLGRHNAAVEFVVELDAGDLWVSVDALRLKQVVMNLAKNAVKFVETGFVRLVARRIDSGRVYIAVEDSGPGIPVDKQLHLFAKYQESLDKLHQGTGIGLCLSKLIVESMGGSIYLDRSFHSGILGSQGSRFVIELPLPPVSPPVMSPKEVACTTNEDATVLQAFEGKALLVVDDDAVVRAILVRRLSKLFPGVPSHVASSAEGAFELMSRVGMSSIAAVFMDHYMPGPGSPMTGVEAIQRLRQEGFDGLIFGCSANDVRKQHQAAGADEFFRKPLPADKAVMATVRRSLALRSVRSVLLVDDELVNLRMFERILSAALPASCSIETVLSAEAALARLGSTSFDVVITDENLGMGMSGSDLALRLAREGHPAMRISLSAGSTSSAAVAPGSFDAFWSKPLPPSRTVRDNLVALVLQRMAMAKAAAEGTADGPADSDDGTPPVSPTIDLDDLPSPVIVGVGDQLV